MALDDDGETVWTRLEPDSRDGRMDEGLRARVHDPLWMLTRQWQLGEFQGEDAGSPVDVYVDVAFDHVSRYRPVGEGEADVTKPGREYDGEPLEALVEREAVLTGERGPNARLAAQGGQTFLRLLRKHTSATPTVDEFADGYVLPESLADADEPVDEEGQRYTDFVGGRVLDGHAVFLAVDAALSGGGWSPNPTLPWTNDADWEGPNEMPTPSKVSAANGDYETAAREYHEWYSNLYEEPETDEDDAWDPVRMEYDFQVATGGPGDKDTTETVLSTAGYTGGRLGWPDFSPVRPGEEKGPSVELISLPAEDREEDAPSLFADGETGGTTTREEKYFLPTKVRFKGMPSRRYWEFEDADVDLSKISSDDVSSQALLNFALVYGNDWYSFPLDTPLGSLVRIEYFSVKDTFGIHDEVFPLSEGANVPGNDHEGPYWNAFSVRDLPNHDEPGLFVPPVFDDVTESDPVERVTMSRDEMANLAFAVEQRFESVTGRPLDRDEYVAPDLVVEGVTPAADVGEESVTFRNPGREPLDVSGWVVANDDGDTFEFDPGTTVEAEGVLTLHSGESPDDEDSATDYYWGSSDPVWENSGDTVVMSVYGPPLDGQGSTLSDDRLELRERIPLRSGVGDDVPGTRYALATDLFDHWFALRPERGEEGATASAAARAKQYFLELALVLDAESLDAATIAELPDPEGRILRPYPENDSKTLRVRDEELRGSGTDVTRSYQKATWTDGTTYLWSGRETSAGKGDVGSSVLRYDVVENWTGEDGA